MPIRSAATLVQEVRSKVPINTPIWLCPVKPSPAAQLLSPHGHVKSLVVNVGIYGRVCDGRGSFYTKFLEAQIAKLGGRKMLYSQNFYSENEFWGREAPWKKTMPSESEYNQLRKKYAAEGVFPNLFVKVCEAARPPEQATFRNRLSNFLSNLLL